MSAPMLLVNKTPSDVGMRFSGDVRPNDVIVNNSALHITFNSTDRFSYPDKGFKLYYEAIGMMSVFFFTLVNWEHLRIFLLLPNLKIW